MCYIDGLPHCRLLRNYDSNRMHALIQMAALDQPEAGHATPTCLGHTPSARNVVLNIALYSRK